MRALLQRVTQASVTVEGKVEVTNSPVFNMSFSDVGGPLKIQTGKNAVLSRIDVLSGNFDISGYEAATIISNDVKDGNLRVRNNGIAFVHRNTVIGDIRCVGNANQDAEGNRATGKKRCAEE